MLDWLLRLLEYFDISEWTGPRITVTFRLNGDPTMPLAGTATLTLSPPDPRLTITARPVTVAVGSNPPISLDAINGPVTFKCNEGDGGVITAHDVSFGGVASPEATLHFTAGDNTTVPAMPVNEWPAPTALILRPSAVRTMRTRSSR